MKYQIVIALTAVMLTTGCGTMQDALTYAKSNTVSCSKDGRVIHNKDASVTIPFIKNSDVQLPCR